MKIRKEDRKQVERRDKTRKEIIIEVERPWCDSWQMQSRIVFCRVQPCLHIRILPQQLEVLVTLVLRYQSDKEETDEDPH